MTNEEAKKWLERFELAFPLPIEDYIEAKEALDMAIKALEQHPCENCISKTELLARIDAERKHLLDIKMDGAEHIVVHHARRIIEDMPSVTPSRPKGKWDILSDDDGMYGICSVCQQDSDFSHYGVAFDFCPNCGADMRGDKNAD